MLLQKEDQAEKATEALHKALSEEMTLAETPEKADYAILLISPSSGEYFNATPGYLELDLCDKKTVCNVDEIAVPLLTPMKKPPLQTCTAFRQLPTLFTKTEER